MKKSTIITTSLCGVAIGLVCLGCNIENTYNMDGVVIDVNNNIITIKDNVKYEYSYINNSNISYTKNDNVIVTFDTNGTDTRQDDYIIAIKHK